MSVSLALTLQRRVQNIVHICSTTTVPDDTGTVQTVQMAPDDIRTFDSVPMVQQFGFSSCPPIGSIAIRICAGGDSGKGICIGTLNHAARPTGLKPGQSVFHDGSGSKLLAGNDNTIAGTATGSFSFTAPSTRAVGNLTATTGYTGTVSTNDGVAITMYRGLITNVSSSSTASGGLINTTFLDNVIAELNSINGCALLQEAVNDAFQIVQAQLDDIAKRLEQKFPILQLLTIPESLEDIITWIGKLIAAVIQPLYDTFLIYEQQIALLVAKFAEIISAAQSALSRCINCSITFPTLTIPVVPS